MTLVIDASALTELLLGRPQAVAVERLILEHEGDIHAPHLIDVEVVSALRRLVAAGYSSPERAAEAIDDLLDLPIERYPENILVPRMWELRDNFSRVPTRRMSYWPKLSATASRCSRPIAGCSPERPKTRRASERSPRRVSFPALDPRFTPMHRGGDGPPLVLLHGFTDTWRTWELVLPALERRHDVLAPTLPGHAGGPPLDGDVSDATYVDFVEQAMDDAGFETADIVGNSLGGYLALRVAERGRARSVVALAPAGGWAVGDDSYKETIAHFPRMQELLQSAVQHADAIASTPEGRQRAMAFMTVNYEHVPPDLVAHMMRGAHGCAAVGPLVDLRCARAGTSTPRRSPARSGSSGARRTACSNGRAPPPATAKLAAARRLGRARRRRPRHPARRPDRGGTADPRLHVIELSRRSRNVFSAAPSLAAIAAS